MHVNFCYRKYSYRIAKHSVARFSVEKKKKNIGENKAFNAVWQTPVEAVCLSTFFLVEILNQGNKEQNNLAYQRIEINSSMNTLSINYR